MTVLGSVFLGDAHHHRVFTTSPPISPTPSSGSASFGFRAQQAHAVPHPEMPPSSPAAISSAASLELRLRWLEALLLGVRSDAASERRVAAGGKADSADTLFRRAEDLQRRLDMIVASSDGLTRFMEHYDRHAPYLTPAFALSGHAPGYAAMSSAELEAFMAEMENDIRAAERDLREIDTLEKRGVTGAGKLADHEALRARLRALKTAHEDDVARAASLERRIASLLEKHASRVDALSELFVAWNDVITEAEDRTSKAERDRERQRSLGFE